MRLLFVFLAVCFAIANGKDKKDKKDETPTTSTTPAPTELEVYQLCLDINRIEINNMEWGKGSKSFWSQTEGIVYVYSPDDSIDTFQTMRFPIIPDANSESMPDESVPSGNGNTRRLQSDTASADSSASSASSSSSTSSTTSTTSTTQSPLPTEFKFKDFEARVGCWIEPMFHELNLRFKLYQFYHTAFKAVTIISIPSIKQKEDTATVTLNTLPYQYADAMVDIEYTLKWKKIKVAAMTPPADTVPVPAPEVLKRSKGSNSGTLKTPGIQPALSPPGPPPVDADAIIDVEAAFDSDEATDNIMKEVEKKLSDDKNVAEKDMGDIEKDAKKDMGEVEKDAKEDAEKLDDDAKRLEDGDNDKDKTQDDFVLPDDTQNSSTDWMLMAAFISAIMGFFVLVYICIWAYKHYGRVEYQKIGTPMKGASKINQALGKVRRISLRNIGKNKNKMNNNDEYDEESRNIMHPSASYTFDDD